ncbi:MFS transporter, partial [Stenotrophomonas sp. SrG]|uniref:MFS transporter n=1 Tax=Stenotrophomonas sp. SrG TaxID=3414430 RepID=UPI003CF29B92
MLVALRGPATGTHYLDRTALAVMLPQLSKDVGATKEDYARLVTVFRLFYAAGQVVFGRLVDRIGTRMGFALSIAGW